MAKEGKMDRPYVDMKTARKKKEGCFKNKTKTMEQDDTLC
jgi:hypothetical protein